MNVLAPLALMVLLAVQPLPPHVDDTLVPYGVHVQEDGGKAGDAPDACLDVDAERGVILDGDNQSGMLMDENDPADTYGFVMSSANVGKRVSLSVLSGVAVGTYDYAFDILAPDCGSSVLEAGSAYYDSDPTPFEPGPGEAAFEGSVGSQSSCTGSGWKFLANQVKGISAPATIFVAWTDGSEAYVPLSKQSQGTVAMYLTDLHTDVTVERFVIVLPASWNGNFQITDCPAGVQPGILPEPTQTPGYAEFTVQQEGQHVILLRVTRTIAEKTGDTVEDLLTPPSGEDNCHRDTCTLAMALVSYDLAGNQAA